MLTADTKRHIDAARQVLVGKVPNPQQQIDQITNALIYKFMDDMDVKSIDAGGSASFFTDDLEQYSWRKLMANQLGAQERLNMYTEALEQFSTAKQLPQLFRDIFRQAFLPYRSPETLNLFLKEIEYFDYNHSEELGNAFEYLLSIMGSQGDAGQFRTPRHIIDFIVDIIDPDYNDTILDPACGTAGFLISVYKHIVSKHDGVDENGKKNNEKPLTHQEKQKLMGNLEGYDISSDMVKLARVNMYLHGNNQPKIYEYDSLSSEERWGDSFDVILANPPFMSPKGGIRPHNKFSVESSRAEVLFVDYIMNHLKPNGRAGIIVPEGIIFQSGKAYKQLRKNLVEDGLLAVISLPAGVFNPYSGVKTSILIFDNTRAKQSKDIVFARVEYDGYDLGAQRRPITNNDLPIIAEVLRRYRENPKSDIEQIKSELASSNFFTIGTSTIGGSDKIGSPAVMENIEITSVSKDKVAEPGDYNLTASRYLIAESSQNQKWPMVELSEVAEVKRGTSITSKQLSEGDIPVIAGGQRPAYFHGESNRSAPVTTISGSGAYAGFVNYFDEPVFVSDASTVQSQNETKVQNRYLFWILKGNQDAVYSLRSGMAQPHVYAKDLAKFKIPLPPIEVQKEIVAELDSYQKIIDSARQIIKNYKPTIKVDPEWDVKSIREVAKVTSGQSPHGKFYNFAGEGLPFYQGKTEFTDKYIGKPKKWTTYTTKEAHKGDILMSVRAPVGPVNIATETICIGRGLAAIKSDDIDRLDQNYLYETIRAQEQHFKSKSSGSTFESINRKDIEDVKIPLPPIETQRAIIAELETEQRLVEANKKLIEVFEQKIKDKIAEVWG